MNRHRILITFDGIESDSYTLRLDDPTVYGDVVPEPAIVTLLAAGAALLWRSARRYLFSHA